MDFLFDGYRRFRERHWDARAGLYRTLDQAQQPPVCIISCCDSRVDPVTIFDAEPGQLFVIRNVANLVPPFRAGDGLQGTSTAIEFAVRNLKVGHIMVLGHAKCGGVAAALDGRPGEDAVFLGNWISLLDAAAARAKGNVDRQSAVEHESIRVSLERLAAFPFVDAAVKAGTLSLSGALFSIFDGQLEVLDSASGEFKVVS
ncbi:MAG: carbonic anhydrase [Micropepsaceae bacterium]